ncbi:glutamine amidotransferase [Marinobacter sp. NP-4(2019)]|uniref:glutamine amidotransferase n=1 Tax=Marinobacter sp. NP-4(2019) TaxID=2488665 RepID=UPI000FC3E50C|nr:glutamine amidotransferase [Marinobacter sp. NP-4(2019)]AZT83199.1 glutamine amidotransferase [Marinobacter sp. NP-4(2019)]
MPNDQATGRVPRLVILKTGSTYPSIKAEFGDFDHWFVRELGVELDISVVNVAAGESPGHPEQWDGIVVTGSPAMVSERADWSERTATWLADAVGLQIPLLGVCYGHQLLAHALGGDVGYHPQGRESGTFDVELFDSATTDPLLGPMPKRFQAQLTHRQSVLRLPENAVLLARNEFEPHQAFRIGRCAWGVQFHPEFTADIMKAYLEVQSSDLETENQDARALISSVADTPEATSLLKRFSELVLNG